mmetsp:Transcript_25097/g.78296  ORF Transcript_25097/g.78296 Transcript_25097/m.78296 type:complete len:324 (+) Transcript_25097:141-1112(+)
MARNQALRSRPMGPMLAILAAATAASSHDLFGPEISACPVSPGEKPDADEAIWSENPPPPSDSENPPPTSDQATSEDPQKPQGWDWEEDFGKPLGPDVEKPDAEQSWNWDEDWKPSGEDGADVVAPGGDGADVAPGGGKTPEAEEAIWSENPPPPDTADGLEAINLGEEEPLWNEKSAKSSAEADTIRDMIIRRRLGDNSKWWRDCDVIGPPPFQYNRHSGCARRLAPDHFGTLCKIERLLTTAGGINRIYVCNTRKECWMCWEKRPTWPNPSDPSNPRVAKRGCPTVCTRPKIIVPGVSPQPTSKWHCYRGPPRLGADPSKP